MKRIIFLLMILGTCVLNASAQDSLSITLDNVKYPFAVKYLPLEAGGQNIRMAYMDIAPASPNGKTVMLFHGKNFGGYYWTSVINALTSRGYRVVVPDQVGFGKSDKALIHYSFNLLARFNKKLLDTLGIANVTLLGHSMGGMLAVRFTLMYPDKVNKLLLEDPIGLEDYRTFVPYVSVDEEYKTELKTTYESVKKYYSESYFTKWSPDYDYLVNIGSGVSKSVNFPRYAKVASLTYAMIYEQPVCYEFGLLKVPAVLFIGKEDNTIIGKEQLSAEEKTRHGQYKILGPETAEKIPNCKLVAFNNCKHIPHIEVTGQFLEELLKNI